MEKDENELDFRRNLYYIQYIIAIYVMKLMILQLRMILSHIRHFWWTLSKFWTHWSSSTKRHSLKISAAV